MKLRVGVNGAGLRVGEDHPNAKLTNCEVDLVRALHDSGMCYRLLAEKFEVSKSLIALICRCERRTEAAVAWKTIDTAKGKARNGANHSPVGLG